MAATLAALRAGGRSANRTKVEIEEAFSMPAEHMVQSYYLLRYIRSRALRTQLLHLLNLYRFAQRKVSHGVLSSQISPNLHLSFKKYRWSLTRSVWNWLSSSSASLF